MSVFQSDISTANAAMRMESSTCPQCNNPVYQEDITITSRGRGLGHSNHQHVEAHCRHCEVTIEFDRSYNGIAWQRTGTIKVIPRAKQTAGMQKRRADLEHAIRIEQDASEPGRDYME